MKADSEPGLFSRNRPFRVTETGRFHLSPEATRLWAELIRRVAAQAEQDTDLAAIDATGNGQHST